MRIDLQRHPLGPVLSARICLVSQHFLLLGVDGNRWAPTVLVRFDAFGDVFKLGIAVWMIFPLAGLSIPLERIAKPFENASNFCSPDLVALLAQCGLQIGQTLACPSQWRLRIATLGRFDQSLDRLLQIRRVILRRLATTTDSPLTA